MNCREALSSIRVKVKLSWVSGYSNVERNQRAGELERPGNKIYGFEAALPTNLPTKLLKDIIDEIIREQNDDRR